MNDEHTLKLIYSAADVTVIPSILESFGLVALEAIHCGSPCVVFNQTGLTSLIEHKKMDIYQITNLMKVLLRAFCCV